MTTREFAKTICGDCAYDLGQTMAKIDNVSLEAIVEEMQFTVYRLTQAITLINKNKFKEE